MEYGEITAKSISISTGLDGRNPEELMIYVARVSNPANQDNPSIVSLLRHCLREGHWSVFEHAYWTVEIVAPLFVIRHIVRHKSMAFSEFSLRYSSPSAIGFEFAQPELRRQAAKNRQSSEEVLDTPLTRALIHDIHDFYEQAENLYNAMTGAGVAKECARAVLPQGIMSRIYASGTARSWIHAIQARTAADAQLETQRTFGLVRDLFVGHFPYCSQALGWVEETE